MSADKKANDERLDNGWVQITDGRYVWACPVCGVLVHESRTDLHSEWHYSRGDMDEA